jgi:hypothetical protein
VKYEVQLISAKYSKLENTSKWPKMAASKKMAASIGRKTSQKKTVIRPYLAKFSRKSNSVKSIEKVCPNAIQKVPLGLRAPLVARAIDLDFFLNRTRPSN